MNSILIFGNAFAVNKSGGGAVFCYAEKFGNHDLPNTSIIYALFLRHGIYPYRHALATFLA